MQGSMVQIIIIPKGKMGLRDYKKSKCKRKFWRNYQKYTI